VNRMWQTHKLADAIILVALSCENYQF